MLKQLIRNWLDIPTQVNAESLMRELMNKQTHGLMKRLIDLVNRETQGAKVDAGHALEEVLMLQAKIDFLFEILGIEVAIDTSTMPPTVDMAHTRTSNLVKKAEEIAGASVDIKEMLVLQRKTLIQQIEIFRKYGAL